ncbi:hypothetical protein L198_07590 [Cryptococcus wingfieldii CBS 7118]|uniref:SET domain-containing protein n=1 Tax=Cryptococcus wingfieldii CBS 7118 TaxID=1295528 RepID=A0A1E3IBI0_9TREE|nr:hypothetical protein L198_07590 [Cryptococcus wingfieldii CBS 7118]ODN85266.1 hypothetical protein L198_07590 [Cryptococcus wingfieldii CBS 7118]
MEEASSLVDVSDTGTLTVTIPFHFYQTLVDSLKVAAARLRHHTTIDERAKDQMVLHLKKAHELHVAQTLLSGRLLQDIAPSLFLTRQHVLEWEAANPGDVFHFYTEESSTSTKVFSTVWHGAKCYRKPMEDLQVIGRQNVAMWKTHEDRIIIGRVITHVRSGLCLGFNIEDPSGAVFPVLNNYPTPIPHFSLSLPDTLSKLYPLGSTLAIKSPRIGFDHRGAFAVKVDMPYEIEEVRPTNSILEGVKWQDGLKEEIVKGWKRYRDAGNGEMRNDNPLVALRLYTLALSDPAVERDPIKTFDLLLNRTEAYRAVHLYGHAYRDAHRAREVVNFISLSTDQCGRLQLRLAKAALGLRLYETALRACEEASPGSSHSNDIEEVKKRIQMRVAEQQSGAYDWLAIFRDSLASPMAELDIPDYISPACSVTQIPGCGRGVIATRDIIPGELIMVSKAIAPSHTKLDAPNVYVNVFDAESQSHVPHATYMWVYRMMHKVYDDPSLLVALGGFSSENNRSPEDLPQLLDEEARLKLLFAPVASSLSLNAFRQVLKTNCYAGRSVSSKGAGFEEVMDERLSLAKDKSPVIYLHGMPSMMNHSCWPNMTECWYGDMMVIRASKHISSGEQLFMSYVRNDPSYPSRLSSLANWDFTCKCTLCTADRGPQDDPHERAQIMDSALPLLFSNPIPDGKLTDQAKEKHRRKAEELGKVASAVEETYAVGRGQGTKGQLARVYNQIGRNADEEILEALIRFLEYAGVTLTTPAQEQQLGRKVYESHNLEEEVILGLMLLAVLEGAKNLEEGSRWARAAVWVHDVRYGGGKALFIERYSHLFADLPVEFDLGS